MRFSLILAVAAVVAGGTESARAGFVILDYPGSNLTSAASVSGGSVAGYYYDSLNRSHGYLYNGTTYTTLQGQRI